MPDLGGALAAAGDAREGRRRREDARARTDDVLVVEEERRLEVLALDELVDEGVEGLALLQELHLLLRRRRPAQVERQTPQHGVVGGRRVRWRRQLGQRGEGGMAPADRRRLRQLLEEPAVDGALDELHPLRGAVERQLAGRLVVLADEVPGTSALGALVALLALHAELTGVALVGRRLGRADDGHHDDEEPDARGHAGIVRRSRRRRNRSGAAGGRSGPGTPRCVHRMELSRCRPSRGRAPAPARGAPAAPSPSCGPCS